MTQRWRSRRGPRPGSSVALLSAVSFGLSGALASPLLDAGWSAGAVVLVRIGAGALVVLPFGLVALRGRWDLLWRNLRLVVMYGVHRGRRRTVLLLLRRRSTSTWARRC